MLRNIRNLSKHRFNVLSYFDRHLSSVDTGVHASNGLKFAYLESGKCKFEIMSGKTKAELLKSGDLILIDSHVRHRLVVPAEAHMLSIEAGVVFDDSDGLVSAQATLAKCPALERAFKDKDYIVINDSAYVKQNILRLHSFLNVNRLEYVDHYFTQLLIATLLLNIDESYANTYYANPYISRITEFIARAYQGNIGIKDIAAAVNLNPSYMQKLFTKSMGNTVYDYLTQFRINKAIALMKNSSMAFEDIASEVGFNNRQTFFNVFKSFTSYTPKQFKKFLATPIINYNQQQ